MIYNVSILLTNSLTNKMNINISKINLEMIFNKFNAIKTKSLKKRKLIKNAKIAKMKVVAKESGRLVIDLTKVLLPLAGSLMIGEKITTSYLEKKEMKPFHKYFRISITEELEYIKCILIVSFSRMEELKEGLY